MSEIAFKFCDQEIVFSNWYQNINYDWVRVGLNGRMSMVIIKFNYDFPIVPLWMYDNIIIDLGKIYNSIYKDNHLTNVIDTQDRVDEFLINKASKITKLLAFA
jgi:hypothetical protein